MTERVSTLLKQLFTLQQPDGSFPGTTATNKEMRDAVACKTPFDTSFILSTLEAVVETTNKKQRALNYIGLQCSSKGTFNYWERNSGDTRSRPYPDDLDDTVVALLAMGQGIDPALQGMFIQSLISIEQSPGGPYHTWFGYSQLDKRWHDIDPIVNAALARLLHSWGALPDELRSYLEEQLNQDTLKSPYYDSAIVGILHLSYLSSFQQNPKFMNLCKDTLTAGINNNDPVATAIGLSSLLRCSVQPPVNSLQKAERILLTRSSQPVGLWKDPDIHGHSTFHGSAAITLALSVSALNQLDIAKKQIPKRTSPSRVSALIISPSFLGSSTMKKQYIDVVQPMLSSSLGKQITRLARNTADTFAIRLRETEEAHLNEASLYGWACYTILDSVLDESNDIDKLPLALTCLRHSRSAFTKALPNNGLFQQTVDSVFDTMDSAIADEHLQTAHTLSKLLSQAYLKSLGHTLVPLAVFYIGNRADISNLQAYFRYHMLAKQLHDDAHDWYADYQTGTMTPVLGWLKQDCERLGVDFNAATKDTLTSIFWEATIVRTVDTVSANCNKALGMLKEMGAMDSSVFASEVTNLATVATRTLQAREQTLTFLRGYNQATRT